MSQNDSYFKVKRPFPKLDWENFPTNEESYNVHNRLSLDCQHSKNLSVVSGYSGLDQIVWFVTRKASHCNIKLVFGHEPSSSSDTRLPSPKRLSEEMRDYWLERGFSPSSNSAVIDAIEALDNGRVEARIHKERFLHAKAYRTDGFAIFGSSNFSKSGLEESRELNGRFQIGSDEYNDISEFMEGCWDRSEEYSQQLKNLLNELLRYTTWQEALARSCASLLEGDWAKELIPPQLREHFDRLWPHQRQGIAQSLIVLENQGAVVVADPTGSGKTRTGGWLLRLAYNRMLSKGGEMATNLTPLLVCPSSVEKNWYQLFDLIGMNPQVLSMGILSGGRKESSINRLKLVEKTNLLAVDEIHNFYGKTSQRTKRLSENLAESRVFLTATPINKEFKDLLKLMKLLGTEELDGNTFSKMNSLEDDINHPEKKRRETARKKASKLIQRFMVRRTRDDLKSIVNSRQDEYILDDGRIANYPEYQSEEFSLESDNEDYVIRQIEELTTQLTGVARISKIRRTKEQKELGISEKQVLNQVLKSNPGLSRYIVWKMLDSSFPALVEHLYGTAVAESEFGVKSGKKEKSQSQGVINKLKSLEMPMWQLSEDFKLDPSVPKWLIDESEFNNIVSQEISIYSQIYECANNLSGNRLKSKINQIVNSLDDGNKVLAFDTSNISLLIIAKELKKNGIETYTFIGSTKGNKGKKVQKAEEKFGRNSDDTPRVALLSDMMSEGINLQGSSVLVHLTIPSTIRLAEQRVGRVDRMDSIHDQIIIYYPERDHLASMMKSYLSERNKLVGDLIGSNIKLPEDEHLDDYSEDDDSSLSSDQVTEKMFKEKAGLFDAFHDVRELIGERGLISEEDYELMRTSKARALSYVGYVRSENPWCFFVIESNKDWAPQWVFLDYSKRGATSTAGLNRDTSDIANLLRNRIPKSHNIQPDEYADECVGKYIDHVRKHQFKLLPARRQHLLKTMSRVLMKWRNVVGHESEIGKRLEELRLAATGSSDIELDLKQIASKWIEYCRDNEESLELKNRKRGRTKKDHAYLRLVDNPPSDFKRFLDAFEHIDAVPRLESRVIAMIAGIPQ